MASYCYSLLDLSLRPSDSVNVHHWPGELSVCWPFAHHTSALVLVTLPATGEIHASERETGQRNFVVSVIPNQGNMDFLLFACHTNCATKPHLSSFASYCVIKLI